MNKIKKEKKLIFCVLMLSTLIAVTLVVVKYVDDSKYDNISSKEDDFVGKWVFYGILSDGKFKGEEISDGEYINLKNNMKASYKIFESDRNSTWRTTGDGVDIETETKKGDKKVTHLNKKEDTLEYITSKGKIYFKKKGSNKVKYKKEILKETKKDYAKSNSTESKEVTLKNIKGNYIYYAYSKDKDIKPEKDSKMSAKITNDEFILLNGGKVSERATWVIDKDTNILNVKFKDGKGLIIISDNKVTLVRKDATYYFKKTK